MKKLLVVLILLVIVLWLASFSKKDEGMVIGVIGPFSGPIADYGEVMRGGILSASSTEKIVFEDDQCDPKHAVSAFTKLTTIDKVDIIIGPACGSPQEAIAPLAKDKVIVLLPSASSEKLHEQSGETVFSLQYSLEKEAKFLAEQMHLKEHSDILLVSYKNAFSQTSADSFKAAFATSVEEMVLNDFGSDVAAGLAALPRKDYDAIVVMDVTFFFSNGVELLERYGFAPPVYSQYAVELPALRTLVEGVTYAFPADMGERNALDVYSANAVEVAHNALERCGKGDLNCLKDFLKTSGVFTQQGTGDESLVLRQIQEGKPVEL
jgi:hypothetical protein